MSRCLLLVLLLGVLTAARRSPATVPSQEPGKDDVTADSSVSKAVAEEDALEPDENEKPVATSSDQFAPRFRNLKKLSPVYTRPSGSSLSLNCQATSNPEPSVTWYRNDSRDWTRTYGTYRTTRGQLIMDDLVPEDSGKYECRVCNKLGCLQHVMQVMVTDRVNHKPILLEGPANLTLL
ncbi:hypothetical protein KR222_000290, partial [Zaprionus bogoriensis]